MVSIRVVARHAKSSRLTGGNKPAADSYSSFSLKARVFPSVCRNRMSRAADLAKRLNSWARDGLDMMGGADGVEISDLISTFMACDEEETQPTECKH